MFGNDDKRSIRKQHAIEVLSKLGVTKGMACPNCSSNQLLFGGIDSTPYTMNIDMLINAINDTGRQRVIFIYCNNCRKVVTSFANYGPSRVDINETVDKLFESGVV